MRRSNTEPLGHIIHRLIASYGWESKLKEAEIYEVWSEIVGKEIALKTGKLALANGVLFIYPNSSVVRMELIKIKEILPEIINRRLEDNIVEEVVIR